MRLGVVAALSWILPSLVLTAAAGCLLELEHRIACGDGHVDRDAGEACEPDDPASFAGACAQIGLPEGTAVCNDTCQIIADVDTCSPPKLPRCGDGVLDDGEACDGSTSLLCPGEGAGAVPCVACEIRVDACPPACGDGKIDPSLHEECDEGDATPATYDCRSQVDTPYQGVAYGSGVATCVACRWDRSDCSYCGNGSREDETWQVDSSDPPLYAKRESCDGDVFDPSALIVFGQCDVGSRPNVGCSATCEPEPRYGEPPCCLMAGTGCDPDDATAPCCARDDPGGLGPACVVDPAGFLPPRCR